MGFTKLLLLGYLLLCLSWNNCRSIIQIITNKVVKGKTVVVGREYYYFAVKLLCICRVGKVWLRNLVQTDISALLCHCICIYNWRQVFFQTFYLLTFPLSQKQSEIFIFLFSLNFTISVICHFLSSSANGHNRLLFIMFPRRAVNGICNTYLIINYFSD